MYNQLNARLGKFQKDLNHLATATSNSHAMYVWTCLRYGLLRYYLKLRYGGNKCKL